MPPTLTFSAFGGTAPWALLWEGPGHEASPLRRAAEVLGGVRQERGEERGWRGRPAGEERGEGWREGPGDTMESGRPNWPWEREGEELWGRIGEMAAVGRSGLPAGGLWTEENTHTQWSL